LSRFLEAGAPGLCVTAPVLDFACGAVCPALHLPPVARWQVSEAPAWDTQQTIATDTAAIIALKRNIDTPFGP
jgi:hypothetical protein